MKSLHLTRPHAIMMVGIPGSGKTFFAKQFANMFKAPYIDSLQVEQFAKDDESAGKLIEMVVTEIVKTNQSFIFEGDMDSRARRAEFARWVRTHGYEPMMIWVQTDQATAKTRSLKANSLDAESFSDILKQFNPPHPTEAPIVISGKHTYATQARIVLKQLTKGGRPTPAQPATTLQHALVRSGNRVHIIR